MGPSDDWFVRFVFGKLVVAFRELIAMERYIMKKPLYCHMSWKHRLSKQDAREVLRMVARTYPGVRFSNRGMFIPKEYLGELD